jgi:AraC family transcriptional regulator of adaptative response/methylated-DNA-[protein]-cysteine methyltransferase
MLLAGTLETPIGKMLAVADSAGLRLLEFASRPKLPAELLRLERRFGVVGFGPAPIIETLREQLAAYFAGERSGFDIALAQPGTAWQASVWDALAKIPAGETRTYGGVAKALGRPEAARAVASANGANTLSILVPCHRLVGADGSLVGYGGGLERKRWLIAHERRCFGAESRELDRLPSMT